MINENDALKHKLWLICLLHASLNVLSVVEKISDGRPPLMVTKLAADEKLFLCTFISNYCRKNLQGDYCDNYFGIKSKPAWRFNYKCNYFAV